MNKDQLLKIIEGEIKMAKSYGMPEFALGLLRAKEIVENMEVAK